ncbi:uncharacterized membrane protein YgdD (TMEM256/DUF423 family) [Nicoletella semolina]|uniref:Uncharacterized membrane protein YgdD (TMEM256/DUF423 family) n=1 Tax=Nicoletella semolina TaxID=271160 RepID=A0A4R2N960_9PAST|nr:DUF423 domain-containing protein [Nicoletella semolina]MDH2925473.1 hypothetical protein [Nicoletella semolina]TCP17547.1 uncharacterized membrane protein YgdD (TMEM256/DUF423 family) [Nicoletella semolina]
MKNCWLFLSAVSGFFCVAFRAFASHRLQADLDLKSLGWIETGLKYQMFHTVSLLALGLFQIANFRQNPPACRTKAFRLIGGSWSLGIALFSGSLYALALGADRGLVWVTPVGGLLFLIGWAGLCYISIVRQKSENE